MELQLTEYKGAYPPTDHFYTQDKTREVGRLDRDAFICKHFREIINYKDYR